MSATTITTTTSKSGYLLESHDETKRLSNQHEVVKAAMGGKLLRAPIDFTKRDLHILDAGTADGTWIRDVASTIPNAHAHTFIGADINDTEFPPTRPYNTAYIHQDVTKPWPAAMAGTFDFVHQRLVLPGAGRAQKHAVQQLAELVAPGGWIQLIEAENIPYPEDGACMHDFISLKRAVFTGMGHNVRITADIPGWLEEAGMGEVKSELFWMELGAANPESELGARGVYSTSRLVETLVPFASGLGDKVSFKESGSVLNDFAADLREELKTKGGHLPLRVLWAQKPLN